MRWGVTFSHRHCRFLGLDPLVAFRSLLDERWDIVRLCIYWNDGYEAILPYLDLAESYKQSIILTVGMKAPRWPEFYIPLHHREDDILHFIDSILPRLKSYTCITHWQVENEPLDPSGPQHTHIDISLLSSEVKLVKSHDDRPVIMTMWGNRDIRGEIGEQLRSIADIVGLDLYPRQYIGKRFGMSRYQGPKCTDSILKSYIATSVIPIWITELQAEPWEGTHADYLRSKTKSMDESILESHIKWAQTLGSEVCLMWGWEWWYMHKRSSYLRLSCDSLPQNLVK